MKIVLALTQDELREVLAAHFRGSGIVFSSDPNDTVLTFEGADLQIAANGVAFAPVREVVTVVAAPTVAAAPAPAPAPAAADDGPGILDVLGESATAPPPRKRRRVENGIDLDDETDAEGGF